MTDISNPEQLRRQTLDLLRFPLAIVVMLVHTWPKLLSIEPQFPLLKAICTIINAFIRNQSVPIYFFIAGYVFFYNVDFNRETYIRKLKNRAKTLLIPYIIWNTVAILILMIRVFVGTTPIGQQLLHLSDIELYISLRNILNCYLFYNGNLVGLEDPAPLHTLNAPLWFIRDLMVIVLITPILYQLIKHLKHYFVIILGIMWFSTLIVNMDNIPSIVNSMLVGIFFFSYGAYMSIHKRDMLVEFGRYFKGSMIIYPSLGILYIMAVYFYPDACQIIKGLNIVAGLLFAYNFSSWLLRKGYCRVSPFLASSAFFIYVSHYLIIVYIANIQRYVINPDSDITQIGLYLSTSILTAGILLSAFYLMRRYTPNLLKVIIGRK